MDKLTFAASLVSGPHSQLQKLCGRWEGISKTFFEPNILADESPWMGTIRPMLNGMFVHHEYTGMLQGKPLTGSAILGYKIGSKQYQCSWTDSFHNGTSIMFCEGKPEGEFFTVLGHYDAPDGSPPWGWRTNIAMTNSNQIVISMVNITPEGIEALAVETSYHRISESS